MLSGIRVDVAPMVKSEHIVGDLTLELTNGTEIYPFSLHGSSETPCLAVLGAFLHLSRALAWKTSFVTVIAGVQSYDHKIPTDIAVLIAEFTSNTRLSIPDWV